MHSLRIVRPLAELQPSAGRGWMPSVTLEASVWTQLGLLCKVEGPLVSVTPVERAACEAEGLSAAVLIHKSPSEFTDMHTHIQTHTHPCSLETFNSSNVKIVFGCHYYKSFMIVRYNSDLHECFITAFTYCF